MRYGNGAAHDTRVQSRLIVVRSASIGAASCERNQSVVTKTDTSRWNRVMDVARPRPDRSSSSSTAPSLDLIARYSERADRISPDGSNQAAHFRTVIFKGLKERAQQRLTPPQTARALLEQGRKTEAFAERHGLPGDWRALAKEAGRAAKAVRLPPHQTLELSQRVAHAAAHADRNTLRQNFTGLASTTPHGLVFNIQVHEATDHNEARGNEALDAFYDGFEEAPHPTPQSSPEQGERTSRRHRFMNWLRNRHRSNDAGE